MEDLETRRFWVLDGKIYQQSQLKAKKTNALIEQSLYPLQTAKQDAHAPVLPQQQSSLNELESTIKRHTLKSTKMILSLSTWRRQSVERTFHTSNQQWRKG